MSHPHTFPTPESEEQDLFLEPPRAPFRGTDSVIQDQSSIVSSPNNSVPLLPQTAKDEADVFNNQPTRGLSSSASSPKRRRGPLLWLAGLAALVIVVLAIVLPVYFTVVKPKQTHVKTATSTGNTGSGSSSSGSGSGSGSSGSSGSGAPSGAITTGGDGSTVTADDGSTFTYSNKFGGFWVSDPNDPFNNNAQPNSWTPPINTSWTWGQDKIYGVNLGGWLVLEPFITPALYQKYPGVIDEWTLSEAMTADTASGGLNQIEDHYNTFITEQDIAEIAGAGLNWVRVAVPFWMIDKWDNEPFLEKTAWKYFLRLVKWCRKYGIRINIDLHTIPGSQNGYNHSGKEGSINFLNGVMGVANAQRALNYIRIITEFISQPEYKDVIPMFGIVNEALLNTIGRDQLTNFYLEAHNMMRGITGFGQGNGPVISIHDGFNGLSNWANFLPGSDRIILDTHPYFAFDGQKNDETIDTGTGANAGGVWPAQACNAWADNVKQSQTGFGFTYAGEFSNGFNDCGLFVRGVGGSAVFGDCTQWQDSTNWTPSIKAGVQAFAMASMDALQNWFFWTWKIGNSTAGIVESPLWSYQLGLQNGWMPLDPRTASGKCQAVGVDFTPFSGSYQPWQTGGAGAGTIAATATDAAGPFPPTAIANVDVAVNLLPTYTSTGSVVTLPPATLSPTPTKSVDVGNGWFDAQDTGPAPTEVAGCKYPDAWDAVNAAVPPLCTGS